MQPLAHNQTFRDDTILTALDRRAKLAAVGCRTLTSRAGENCESRSCTDTSLLSAQHSLLV